MTTKNAKKKVVLKPMMTPARRCSQCKAIIGADRWEDHANGCAGGRPLEGKSGTVVGEPVKSELEMLERQRRERSGMFANSSPFVGRGLERIAELKKKGESASTFPMSGPYMNDCPLCNHHNAILEHWTPGGFIHECRDCKTKFIADNAAKTYSLIEAKPEASTGWPNGNPMREMRAPSFEAAADKEAKHDDLIEKVARSFAAALTRDYLTDKERRRVLVDNEKELASTKPNQCCHTHDYCDANMAMLDAFVEVLGRETRTGDDDDGTDTNLWNSAWSYAKSNRFWWADVAPSAVVIEVGDHAEDLDTGERFVVGAVKTGLGLTPDDRQVFASEELTGPQGGPVPMHRVKVIARGPASLKRAVLAEVSALRKVAVGIDDTGTAGALAEIAGRLADAVRS